MLFLLLVLMVHGSFSEDDDDRHNHNPTDNEALHPPSLPPIGVPSESPSLEPSNVPSTSPSPSLQPTIVFTPNPTETSSTSPSSYPSTYPSSIPSRLLSNTPSSYPSQEPTIKLPSIPSREASNVPSSAPSNVPSYETSNVPSHEQSTYPTSDPSISISDACLVSPTGFFGEVTSNEILIDYNYQIEYWESTSIDNIVSSLEVEISDLIVHSIVSDCAVSSNTIDSPFASTSTEEMVVGISALTDDKVTGNDCQNPTLPGVTCDIVEGRLTLFLQESARLLQTAATIIEIKDSITSLIHDGMENNELTFAHIAIVKLTFISDPTTDETDGPANLVNNTQEIRTDDFPMYGWVIIACIVTVLAGIVGRQGKKIADKRRGMALAFTEGASGSKDRNSEYSSDLESNEASSVASSTNSNKTVTYS